MLFQTEMCIPFTQAFGKRVITPQHLSGQISSFTCSSSTHLVPCRRLALLLCPAWKYECCWWCPFGASLAWGWPPLGWTQDQGCARDTVSSLAEGVCSPGDIEPRWCFTVFSNGLRLAGTTARCQRWPGQSTAPLLHGQAHLLHLSPLAVCLSFSRGWLCLPATLWHTTAQLACCPVHQGSCLTFR